MSKKQKKKHQTQPHQSVVLSISVRLIPMAVTPAVHLTGLKSRYRT